MTEISQIVVPTRDRPLQCAAAIESYLRHLSSHSRSVRLVICDQSLNSSNSELLRRTSQALTQEFSHELTYVDRTVVDRIVSHAHKCHGFDLQILRFLLQPECPQAYGANRNVGMLISASTAAMFVDDDTLCLPMEARRREQREDHLDVDEPWVTEAFHSEEAMLAGLKPRDDCLLHDHEALLGHDCTAIKSMKIAPSINLSRTWQSTSLEERRVRVVSNGIYGDSGMQFFSSQIASPQYRLRRRIEIEPDLMSTLSGRHCLRRADYHLVRDSASFISTVFSIDNREPLFPFFPYGRGEDTLFGLLNELSGGLIADSPTCLRHARSVPHPVDIDFCQPTLSAILCRFFSLAASRAPSTSNVHPVNRSGLVSAAKALESLRDLDIEQLILESFRHEQVSRLNIVLTAIGYYRRDSHEIIRILDRQALLCEADSKLTLKEIERIVIPAGAPGLVRGIKNYCAAILIWESLHDLARDYRP